MKRKSILAGIIIVAISLVGCNGNSGTGNNATGNPNTANNATGTTDGNNATDNTNTNAGGNNDIGSSSDGMGGTGNPNTANNSTGNTNNDITNSTGSINNSLDYTAANFKDDVINAGYKLDESANTNKNYFSGKETDYLMGNDIVRVYEYNSPNDLQGDISRISQNGLTINGTDANYTRKPFFYRKGNSLIMYEGNEPAYTDHFKTMYGNTLIP